MDKENKKNLENKELSKKVKFIGILNLAVTALFIILSIIIYIYIGYKEYTPENIGDIFYVILILLGIIGLFVFLVPSIFLLKIKNWARLSLGYISILSSLFWLCSLLYVIINLLFIMTLESGIPREAFDTSVTGLIGSGIGILISFLIPLVLLTINIFTFYNLIINKEVKEYFNQIKNTKQK